jgi:peptidoglycan/LPS O-acetylase OafA/YrhL
VKSEAKALAPHRYAALDGWRGICACLVALYHWRAQLGYSVNSNVGALPIVRNSYLFVDFFFVLSGFVIAAGYQDRLSDRAVKFTDFLALRLGRLLPLQLFTLLLTVAITQFIILQPHDWIEFSLKLEDVSLRAGVLNALLLHGMHTTTMLTWNHPSWSISVEFWTYVAFAGAWLALRRNTWIFALAAACLLPGAILRLKGHMNTTFDWGFLRAMFGFALGVLVFNGMRRLKDAPQITPAIAGALEVLCVAVVGVFVWFAGETPFSIDAPFVFALTVAVFSLQRGPLSRALSTRPAEALGRWSYSIYLLQFPLQIAMMFFALYVATTGWVPPLSLLSVLPGGRPSLGATRLQGDLTNVVMLLLLIACSALTYRLIEAPARQRVRRWVQGRAP